jgi:antitoxin ParD1/3/4
MRTRNVVVTDGQDEMIDELVQSGRYQNASEVLREGLRLVGEREAKVKALREAARIGASAIEQGHYLEFTSSKELSNHLRKIAARAIGGPRLR